LTEKTARRWFAEERIKSAELLCLVGTATDPALGMCRDHAIGWLEDRRTGAAAAIRGNSMRGWRRNFGPGLTIVRAMWRAGLIKFGGYQAPYGRRQCKATSKRSGKRCRQWCLRDMTTCKFHGALGGPYGKLKPGDPELARLKRLQAEKKYKAEQVKIERQRRWLAGMLSPRTGYNREKPQPQSLYDQFREGGRGPPRKRDSWSPY
jgi:hypothetical protein